MTDFGSHGDDLIDLDYLLDNIDELNCDWLAEPVDNLPDSGCDLSIEDFLVNDDVLFSGPPPKDSSSSPDSDVVQKDEGLDVVENNAGDGSVEDDDDDSADPADKQRKRYYDLFLLW